MARKKDKRSSARSRKPRKPQEPDSSAESFEMPDIDPRLMEQMMKQFLSESGMQDARSPELIEADALVQQAYECDDYEERMELAATAISVCPECADAFICLAEMAPSASHAVTMYQMAVDAGIAAMGGDEGMSQYEDAFWGALETRPYMRAKLGLSQALWGSGHHGEAIGHAEEILALNPGDNQGVRYLLSSFYCDQGMNEQLETLLAKYEDDGSAHWSFSRALLAYRQEGDSANSRERLQQAHQGNPSVAEYLLGNRALPAEPPGYIEPGGETEAISYVGESLPGWRAAQGSLPWVRQTLQIELADTPPPRPRPQRRLLKLVADLPREEMVWQVDLRRTDFGGADAPTDNDPWTLIVTSPTIDELLLLEAFDDEVQPTPNEVLDQLLETMLHVREVDPHRPAAIELTRKTYEKAWRAKLDKLDIECRICDELDHIEYVLDRLETVAGFTDLSLEDLEQQRDELSELPQDLSEVWQADVRSLATWITEEGVPQRPRGALVSGGEGNFILSQRISLDAPSADLLWEAVLSGILSPAVGPPRVPGTIEVISEEFCDMLSERLSDTEVECVVRPQLEDLDNIYGELEAGLSENESMSAMIDTPGVTPTHVGSFFDAAATFYRQQPWRKVLGDTPISIRCDHFQTNTWYCVVMGQSGVTMGMALYEDLEVLQSLLREDSDSDRNHAGLSVLYGEAFEIAVRDLDAAERNGWPVAAPEAYPMIVRINPGMAVRAPLAWELELAEACLRAIPSFLNREASTDARMAIPTAAGELDLELSWMES